LASARAYLLFRAVSFVAATIMTAIGNERISISVLRVWSLTWALIIASSVLFSALSRILVYSGLFSSVILMSSFCTCCAASGVKGYLARSACVRTSFFPSVGGMGLCSFSFLLVYSTSMRGAR